MKSKFFNYSIYRKTKTGSVDISADNPKKFEQLKMEFIQWNESVERSIIGMDYPEKMVRKDEPERYFWANGSRYEVFIKNMVAVPSIQVNTGR